MTSDPFCCNSKNAPDTPARMSFALDEDGPVEALARARVALNPPYGRVIGKWLDKLRSEYETGDVTAAIGLAAVAHRYDLVAEHVQLPDLFYSWAAATSARTQEQLAPFPSAVVCILVRCCRVSRRPSGQIGTIYYTPYGVSDLPPSPTWPR